MILAMDVSTENAIGYLSIGLVLIVLIICMTYLIAKGRVPWPPWSTGENDETEADSRHRGPSETTDG